MPNPPAPPVNAVMRGVGVIDAFARSLPLSPGVYRMLNAKGEPLYIGKARQLQKRVLSYTQFDKLTMRLQRMVIETATMEVVHTRTEAEALLLEANMIRQHMPRYNVLLRDDKSVPYIYLSGDHPFPLLTSHRGAKVDKGDYYGPFASAEPVWSTIAALQRVFQIRNCSDAFFAARTRPCLQYHIKRCTAPCVGKVDEAQYGEQVKAAKQFLEGKTSELQQTFAQKMQEASTKQDYELAANFRDKIRALTTVQSKQDINLEGVIGNVDVIAAYLDGGQACIQIFFFREGRNYGNKPYFPRHDKEVELPEILEAFISQFYQTRPAAKEILVSHEVAEQDILAEALSIDNQTRITISAPQRGDKKRLIDFAVENAKRAHARTMADQSRQRAVMERLADLVGLDVLPERIEVFDNSHLGGTNPLGVMIVVCPDGFDKKHYRKFNIKGKYEQGDDYAMMREVLTRRLGREVERINEEHPTLKEFSEGETNFPDLMIVDGGKGQLSSAQQVLADLNLHLKLIAISKGPDRNAGREWIHFTDKEPVQLPANDPLLYFLQRIRDEAHRFAITGQRAKRKKDITASKLDNIPGIGGKRKKALLLYFGSAKSVERAGVEDLMKVEGINRSTAETIYNFFHDVK